MKTYIIEESKLEDILSQAVTKALDAEVTPDTEEEDMLLDNTEEIKENFQNLYRKLFVK